MTSHRETESDDAELGRAAARFAPVEPAPRGACPDDGSLAGYADGHLGDEERGAVEGHLARCEPCRALVAVIARHEFADEEPVALRRSVGWRRSGRLVAAAAVLAVAGAALWASWSRDPSGVTVADAAGSLARAHPEVFEGFAADLARPDSLAFVADPLRGDGVVLVAPSGIVLDGRPAFRFAGVPSGEPVRLALFAGDGGELFAVDTIAEGASAIAFPAGEAELAAGLGHLCELTVRGAKATRYFRVASVDERARYERGRALIANSASAGARDGLAARWAVFLGLDAEAERLALVILARRPDDELARRILALVRHRMGSG